MPDTAVTRITHSCHLIEIGGRTFLTDPWFSTKPGYYQGEPIAIDIADLPTLDAVLISHAHYDHCDLKAFAAYRNRDTAGQGGETAGPRGDELLDERDHEAAPVARPRGDDHTHGE